MRGPSKTPPKYRKHRASGQAIVTLSGQDFYLGPHGTKTSKDEYDRLVGLWLANGRRLPDQNQTEQSISIMRLCAEYLKHCKTYYVKNGKPTDEQAGVKAAIRFLKDSSGKIPAADFGPLALEAVRDEMIETGNSRRYINQNIGRIRRMFRWGVSRELLPAETYHRLQSMPGLKKGKCDARETGPVLPVPDHVVDATIAELPKVAADMVRFQRLTGCRPGEVCAIRPCDIDRDHEVWRYWPESHKMEHKDRSRVILIGPQAQQILKPYLLRPADQHCFLRRSGQRYERRHYSAAITRACDRVSAKLSAKKGKKRKERKPFFRWAPNRLRHSAGTEIRKKFGIEATQVVLGHAQLETSQVYAERDIARAAEIMAEVG